MPELPTTVDEVTSRLRDAVETLNAYAPEGESDYIDGIRRAYRTVYSWAVTGEWASPDLAPIPAGAVSPTERAERLTAFGAPLAESTRADKLAVFRRRVERLFEDPDFVALFEKPDGPPGVHEFTAHICGVDWAGDPSDHDWLDGKHTVTLAYAPDDDFRVRFGVPIKVRLEIPE